MTSDKNTSFFLALLQVGFTKTALAKHIGCARPTFRVKIRKNEFTKEEVNAVKKLLRPIIK